MIRVVFSIIVLFVANSSYGAMSAYVRFKNPTNGLCLGVDSKSSGSLIKQMTCASTNSQTFLAVVHDDGSHIFKNKGSALCVGIKGAVSVDKTVLEQQACNHEPHQNFTPSFQATGQYNLISHLDGSCVTVLGTTTGTSALRYNCKNASSQRFHIQVVSGQIPLNRPVGAETAVVPVAGPALPKIQQGVHLGGAESGNLTDKNKYGWHYAYPNPKLLDYFKSKNITTVRLSFKSARLQSTRSGPLNQTELGYMNKFIQEARSRGIWVILDPHDYGAMADANKTSQLIGTAAMPATHFADFWARVAKVFLKQPNVIFGLMNEPNKQTARQWQPAAILGYSAIRQQGAKQLVLIPGTKWTGAHSWISSGNGKVWQGFRGTNYAFEVHQYVDTWSSGTLQTCPKSVGSTRLVKFRDWATTYGHRGFVGEVGWATNTACMNEGKAIFTFIRDNPKVFMGFTYFGAAWYRGFMTLNPIDEGTPNEKDRPQLQIFQEVF